MATAPPAERQIRATHFTEEDIWFAFWIAVCIFNLIFPSLLLYVLDGIYFSTAH